MNGARLVLRRAGAHRQVLLAAFAIVLIASTVLVATSLYARAVAGTGLRAALLATPVSDRTVHVDQSVDAADATAPADRLDRAVRVQTRRTFAGLPTTVVRSGLSQSFALPGQGDEVSRLAVLGFLDGEQRRARLVAGSWSALGADDAGAAGSVVAAVPAAAASALDLSPGDLLELGRRTGSGSVPVVVGAVYRPQDSASAVWAGDELADGVERGGSFTTYGPLLVGRATFLQRFAEDSTLSWLLAPRLAGLTLDQRAPLLERLRTLTGTDEPGVEPVPSSLGSEVDVSTYLDQVLVDVAAPVLVGRSSVVMPSVLLVVLAGVALLLAMRLLREHRTVETALLRARGTSGPRMVRFALGEALLLCLPAAALAPLVATGALGLSDALLGEHASVSLSAPLTAPTWLLAALVGLAAALASAAPAVRGASLLQTQHDASRPEERGLAQRTGLDLVLLVLAGLALWQLLSYGSTVIRGDDATGQTAVDPLLVAVPGLLVAAGATAGLRLLRPVARLAEQVGRRARGVVRPLGTWHAARLSGRHAGPALLLALAVACGTFALTAAAAWQTSQDDQATFRTGADVRVVGGSTSLSPELPAADELAGLDGVRAAAEVDRVEGRAGDGDVTVLAVDAAASRAVVTLRDDLAGTSWSELASRLTGSGSTLPALASRDLVRRLSGADQAVLSVGDDTLTVRVVGELERVPTVTGSDPGLVVDLDSLADHADLSRASLTPEVWLATDGPTGPVAGAVQELAPSAVVLDRDAETGALRGSPVPLGVRAVLAGTAVVALVLALIGFAMATTVAWRGRRAELAALRAIGLAPGEVRRLLALEQVLVVTFGVVLGLAVGRLVAWLVAARLVLTPEAAAPVPAATVPLALPAVALFCAVLLLGLGVVVTVVSWLAGRLGVADELRLGEDT